MPSASASAGSKATPARQVEGEDRGHQLAAGGVEEDRHHQGCRRRAGRRRPARRGRPAGARAARFAAQVWPKISRTLQARSPASTTVSAFESQPTGMPGKLPPGTSSQKSPSPSKISRPQAVRSPASTTPSPLQSPRRPGRMSSEPPATVPGTLCPAVLPKLGAGAVEKGSGSTIGRGVGGAGHPER